MFHAYIQRFDVTDTVKFFLKLNGPAVSCTVHGLFRKEKKQCPTNLVDMF